MSFPKHVRGIVTTADGRDVIFDIQGSAEYVKKYLAHVGELACLRYDSGRTGPITYAFCEPGYEPPAPPAKEAN